MKKNVSTFALALLAAASTWAQTFTVNNLKYTVTDETAKTVELTGYETDLTGTLDIPASVSHENTDYRMTSIGEKAFYGCSALEQVTIPNSVTNIGASAFYNCSTLTQVTIGNDVTSIGEKAFYGCYALTQIKWNAINCKDQTNNMGYVTPPFYSIATNITEFLIGEQVKYIPIGLCYGMSKLTQISIPDSVESIGIQAFDNCTALTQIKWNAINYQDSTIKNPYRIFYAIRSNITNFTFGKQVKHIPAYLCYGMSKLTQISIPDNVESIGIQAFDSCTALTQIKWNAINYQDSMINDTNNPFHTVCSNISNFTFGEQIEHIPAYLCYGMSKLTQIEIPGSVKSIGDGAFYNCSNLSQIIIPDYVKTIGNSTFKECTGLTKITIGKNVKNIGDLAFANCSQLTEILIPDSVTDIKNSAFSGCNGIKEITWNAINYKDSTANNPNNLFYTIRSNITNFTFGEQVEHIPAYLCYGMSKLTQIKIPNNVKSIGDLTFCNCSALTKIQMGSGIINIGDFAFLNCSGLAEMTIHAIIPPIIGTNAFYNVSRDIPVYVPAETLEDYKATAVWNEFNLKAMQTALQTPSMPESISVYGGLLHNPQGLPISIYDMQGRMVYSGTAATVSQPAGVYVVRCAGASSKVLF